MSFYIYASRTGFASLSAVVAVGVAHAQAPDGPVLTLEQAFARAVGDAPGLKAAEQARLGAEAGLRQADRAPNPTLDLAAENFAGGSQYRALDRAEMTFSLSQRLEWGGDREARTRLAAADVSAARAGAGIREQSILHEVELAYLAAQRAGSELQVALDRAALAREIVATVERRVQAARDPLLAGARSKTALAEAEIAVQRAQQAEQAARAYLSSLWGGDTGFSVDLSAFGRLDDIPRNASPLNAELSLAAARESRAEASIEVESARSKLDPTVSAGLRYFNETDEAALVVGLSIPLSIWDKNDGAVARAHAERAQLRYETEALRRNLEREVAATRSQMAIARVEVESIDRQLLPAAEEALAQARRGYNAGGFSYLDVLEAQRVVVGARLQRISALNAHHIARIALARLLGDYATGATTK